jgi:hypothetical protein
MVARAHTVAFEGVEARPVEVQCAVSPGLPGFTIVGLPDKAVSEARERVRAALSAMSIALPSKRITINLSPADLPKEGSHFDLPIAIALLAALDILPKDAVDGTLALGELSLDGTLVAVIGALPAAMAAAEDDRILLCPRACGSARHRSLQQVRCMMWCAITPARPRLPPPRRARFWQHPRAATCAMSRVRNGQSGRWKSLPPGGTMC